MDLYFKMKALEEVISWIISGVAFLVIIVLCIVNNTKNRKKRG